MKVIHQLDQLPDIDGLVLTIGTFDGVHRGHQELLQTIISKANSTNGTSGLITFHPHPRMILNPGNKSLKLLTSIEERAHLLEQLGLDYLFIVPFSADFSSMSAEAYVKDFLVGKFHPKHIVIGYDHRFGKGRSGGVELLNELAESMNYELTQINEQTINDITLSSTKIRELLGEGSIEAANELLGYRYTFEGYVVHGEKRGRTIGFPTANLVPTEELKLIPGNGVYAVLAEIDGQQHPAMLNIGTRPTFDGKSKTIEAHILDYEGNLYGKKLVITFACFVRSERQFSNSEELINQLNTDEKNVRKTFSVEN
ncbi:MAG: bifunctional riboflavin kinase/FAD synthetase [Saprospiraceae bacterium]|nr:bifunctional riboflavin kinase/FAD synthetase [Saprospiraceae bacterium]